MAKGEWLRGRDSKVGTRQQVQKALIVCNSQSTEKNYFESAGKFLNAQYKENTNTGQNAVRFEIYTDATTPQQILQKTKRKWREYDVVWFVFDKDDLQSDKYDNTIKDIEKLYEKNKSTKFFALHSNQCFELWFLLYFDYYCVATDRKTYFDKLAEKLDAKKYDKADDRIFDKLLEKCGAKDKKGIDIEKKQIGVVAKAMANARRLYDKYDCQQRKNMSQCDPITTVHLFFDYYFEKLRL